MVIRYAISIWIASLLLATPAHAIPPLYIEVANEHNVPAKVLYGLALTESQKKLTNGKVRPWPWTLNMKGKPYYYSSSEQACVALTRFLSITTVIDIGLTQQNWRYQGSHFVSPCSALDPKANLSHAAILLKQGYRVHGTWLGAAGWFHRPAGGAIAEKYKTNFVNNYRSIRYD